MNLMKNEEEKVILVNEKDEPIGLMGKMEAHEKGLLHRAFSVFVFNDKDEVMIQQRAAHKYHSPLLWANTCCSHPREGEGVIEAGKRRLREEMGFETPLEHRTAFVYKAPFDNGLTEYEYDHILVGRYNGEPHINPDEVLNWRWVSLPQLQIEIKQTPEQFTAWFKIIFDKYYDYILRS